MPLDDPDLDARCAWLVLLAPLLIAASLYHGQPYDNVLVRWVTARALVEHGTWTIDAFDRDDLRDKAVVDGRVVSDKAPGSSLLAALAYAPFHRLIRDDDRARYAVRVLTVSFPAALLALLLYRAARHHCGPRAAALLALAFALGSHALPYASLLYAHLPVAALGFAALLLAVPADPEARATPTQLALAGALLGAAIATEYPAGLFAIVIGLATLARHRAACWPMIAGAAPPLALLLAYHTAVFGSPFATGYDFHFEPHLRAAMRPGLAGVTVPTLDRLALIAASPARGLLFCAPWILLTVAALPRCRTPRLRVAAAVGLAFCAFNAAYSLPDGGWAAGPRHLLPGLPMLALLVAPLLRDPRWTAALAGLALAGAARNLLAAGVDPHVPEAILAPIRRWWLPLLDRGMAGGCFWGPTWLALPLTLALLTALALGLGHRPTRPLLALTVAALALAAQLWAPPDDATTARLRAETLDAQGHFRLAFDEALAHAPRYPDAIPLWQLVARLAGDDHDRRRRARELARHPGPGPRALRDALRP